MFAGFRLGLGKCGFELDPGRGRAGGFAVMRVFEFLAELRDLLGESSLFFFECAEIGRVIGGLLGDVGLDLVHVEFVLGLPGFDLVVLLLLELGASRL